MRLSVRIPAELRLAGALLAAGDWPDREQALKAYKPHRVAETARRHCAPHRDQPAVQAAADLAAHPSGQGAQQLYAHAAAGTWPAALAAALPAFSAAAQPDTLWADTAPAWEQAETDLCAVLGQAGLPEFLETVFGPLSQTLVIYPNLLYPGRQSLAFEANGELFVCQPPPPAWGTSPPWRYHERPDEVLARLATTAAQALFERRLPAAHEALRMHAATFAVAAAVLCLRQAQDLAAADQFMLMEKKARGLPHLPQVVAALEAALAARAGSLDAYIAELALVLEQK